MNLIGATSNRCAHLRGSHLLFPKRRAVLLFSPKWCGPNIILKE
jgi:hypothetical protein